MDETLTRCVIDLSGRSYLVYDVAIPAERIGTFETEMLREFLYAVAVHGRMIGTLTGLEGREARTMFESEGADYIVDSVEHILDILPGDTTGKNV